MTIGVARGGGLIDEEGIRLEYYVRQGCCLWNPGFFVEDDSNRDCLPKVIT